MLVTFSTKAYADITLFGDIALTLLKMMVHSATITGAILAADVPAVGAECQLGVVFVDLTMSRIYHLPMTAIDHSQ
jgi:hypothetical protein